MRLRWSIVASCVLLVALVGAPVRGADTTPLLTAVEVQKLVDAGQYADALKALARILELKGAAGAGYERHDMLMLRAECLLQTKQNLAALDTLELARKEAAAASNDEHALGAQAFNLLIRQSPGNFYTPRSGTMRKPIPILDRILRKAAYDALFADEMALAEVKVRAAKSAKSLPPIVEAAKAVAPIRPVERASVGDNKQTDQIVEDLSKAALKLIATAIDDLTAQTDRISISANRVITEDVTVQSGGRPYTQTITHRKGLQGQDAANLKNIIAECQKIAPSATELAQTLNVEPAPYKDLANKADLLHDKAKFILTDDYMANVR